MAVFNNGRITASITPPSDYQSVSYSYRYTLYKYDQSTGNWVVLSGFNEGFTGTFINPTTTASTTHIFGNPGGYDENKQGDLDSWVGLAPGNYKVIVEALVSGNVVCTAEMEGTVGTQDPGDPVFTCSDTSITIPNGTVGNQVTATATNGVVGTITPSQYQNGTQSYDVEITVPAGYSNVGSTITCQANGTGSPALTEFTCTDANFQVADGTTGQDVVATVAAGTLNSVSPAQYVEGSAIYTANITVPAGYSNSGATLTTCTDTAVGSTTLTEFTCTDANFQVADGTTGQDVVATVAAGTLNSVSPAQYVEGSAIYTANITVPAGYSNSGTTLTTCTDTAVGSTVTSNNITWYWFHGIDRDWLRFSGTATFCTAPTYFLRDGSGGAYDSTTDVSVAMQYYFDNQASIDGGMGILTTEWAGPITGDGQTQEFVFNETVDSADFFIMVPATSDFTEDLTTDGVTWFPAGTFAGNAFEKINVTVDGEAYVLYQLQGSATTASRTCAFD